MKKKFEFFYGLHRYLIKNAAATPPLWIIKINLCTLMLSFLIFLGKLSTTIDAPKFFFPSSIFFCFMQSFIQVFFCFPQHVQ